MSGNAGAPYIVPLRNPKTQTIKVAMLCQINDAGQYSSEKLANALRSVDALTLVNSSDGLKYWNVDPLTNFRPVIESSDNPEAFLIEDPSKIISSGNYTKVPWMTGLVPNEGAVRLLSLFSNNIVLNEFNSNFNDLFSKLMEFPSGNAINKSEQVTKYYLNGKHNLDNTTFEGFMNVCSVMSIFPTLFTFLLFLGFNRSSIPSSSL